MWTYDRHGNAVEMPKASDDDTEERRNALDLIRALRGVYATKEEAEMAAKPQWVATGPKTGYWE